MITSTTRLFCAALSAVTAAGLVAFSTPGVTIAPATPQAAVQLAAAPLATTPRG